MSKILIVEDPVEQDGKLTFTTTHLSEYGIVGFNTSLEEKDN